MQRGLQKLHMLHLRRVKQQIASFRSLLFCLFKEILSGYLLLLSRKCLVKCFCSENKAPYLGELKLLEA